MTPHIVDGSQEVGKTHVNGVGGELLGDGFLDAEEAGFVRPD